MCGNVRSSYLILSKTHWCSFPNGSVWLELAESAVGRVQRCVVRGITLSSLLSCRLPANLNLRGSSVAPTWAHLCWSTRKQKRPRVNSLMCDRAAAFCGAGPPEVLSRMSRPVTQATERERELARACSQRLKQAARSLPGEPVSRGFAGIGALEGYPSHYTSLGEFYSFNY